MSAIFVHSGTTKSDAEDTLDNMGLTSQSMNWAVVFNSLTRPSFVVFGSGGDEFISGEAKRPYERTRDEYLVSYENKFQSQIEYFIYPQSYPGQPPEELIVGSHTGRLVYSGWKPESPRLLGISLRGPIPGYQFALYKTDSSDAEIISKSSDN